jgi:hypothetical protein
MYKFSQIIYGEFGINLTTYKTFSSIAIGVYLTRPGFYDSQKNPIKLLDGMLEKDIRKAYYGGIVQVIEHECIDSRYYDINSQYSDGIMNDMPAGDPIYTNDIILKDLFGFCYARVEAPSEEKLRVLLLPYRDDTGQVTTPRGQFEGM